MLTKIQNELREIDLKGIVQVSLVNGEYYLYIKALHDAQFIFIKNTLLEHFNDYDGSYWLAKNETKHGLKLEV